MCFVCYVWSLYRVVCYVWSLSRFRTQEGVLEVVLNMFFKYEWTSVLHQSITRIVTWIMDAGPSR